MKAMLWVLATALLVPACGKHKTTDVQTSQGLTTVYQEPADRPAPSSDDRSVNSGDCTRCDEAWEQTSSLHTPQHEAAGAPAGTDDLARQLRARHAEDLPQVDELLKRSHAAESLRYVANHGQLLIERQRALSLLRHFPSPETRALLIRVGGDDEALVPLRAAALRSLRVLTDAQDDEAQRVIAAARLSEDARIRASVTDTP